MVRRGINPDQFYQLKSDSSQRIQLPKARYIKNISQSSLRDIVKLRYISQTGGFRPDFMFCSLPSFIIHE